MLLTLVLITLSATSIVAMYLTAKPFNPNNPSDPNF